MPCITPPSRTAKVIEGSRANPWEDKLHICLHNDPEDDEEASAYLLDGARNMLHDGHRHEGSENNTPTDTNTPTGTNTPTDTPPIPSRLTRRKILEWQQTEDSCQTVLAKQRGRDEVPFFENKDGVLCR